MLLKAEVALPVLVSVGGSLHLREVIIMDVLLVWQVLARSRILIAEVALATGSGWQFGF